MKRFMSIISIVLLMIAVSPLVCATENDPVMEQFIQQEHEPKQMKKSVEVGSFEELQVAINTFEDGNTITLTQGNIHIPNGTVLGSADKQICIQLIDDYLDTYYSEGIFILDGGDMTTYIKNIKVDGSNVPAATLVNTYCNTEIEDSVFCNFDTGDYSLSLIRGSSIAIMNIGIRDCKFYNIRANHAGIYTAYQSNTAVIENCEFENITGNGYALIANDGEMILGANYYKGGLRGSKDRLIGNSGKLVVDNDLGHYIDYYGYAPQGWHKITDNIGTILYNPQKVETEVNETCGLAFFTEQATDYIAPDQSQNDNDDPDNSGEENSEDTQPPQEPGDQAGDNDATDENHPLQEPIQPPEGEKTDDPTDNPDSGDNDSSQEPVQPPEDGGEDDTTDTPSQEPELPQDDNIDDALDEGQDTPQPPQSDSENESDENPEQSVEPPQAQTQPKDGESEDNPADSTETPVEPPQGPSDQDMDNTPDNPDNTPDTSQKPSDSDNGEDGNYTPPADYRPSYRPTQPSTSNKQSAETDPPQEKPDNTPAPMEPQLTCNGAVIDTSRTVVLLGYGDGLLHEDDPLTRGQLAAIIYRLLDDESIALYSNAQLAFVDVAADAWYTPYVRVIEAAGIVYGVGDGKFDPNGTVTWSHIVTILTRFVEPQEYTLRYIQYDGWAKQAIQTAVAFDWIRDKAYFDPDTVISRGELVQLVNGVLELYR